MKKQALIILKLCCIYYKFRIRNELMNTISQTDEETVALALLISMKLPLLEAAQVAYAAVRAERGSRS